MKKNNSLLLALILAVFVLLVPVALANTGSSSGQSFVDVPIDHHFYEEIERLVAAGIAEGWPVNDDEYEFRPGDEITRMAMAAFLDRGLQLEEDYDIPEDAPSFVDVDPGHPFYEKIERLVAAGIAEGWPVNDDEYEFRPGDEITRMAMAAFLDRGLQLEEDYDIPEDAPSFVDVDPGHPFYEKTERLVAAGIAEGWSVNDDEYEFRPGDEITRMAMAAMLYRALELEEEGYLEVVSSDPADGAEGIALDTTIDVTFDRDIAEGDEFDAITLAGNGNELDYTTELENEILSIAPDEDLAHDTEYTVTIPADALEDDKTGAFGLEEEYSFSFNTTEIDVSPTIKVSGSFDEVLDQQTLLDNQETTGVGYVVLIYPNRYKTVEVVDNSFEFEIERDGPVGVSFVDKAGNYLGYLNLGDGIIGIPGQAVAQEIAALDLGEVTGDDGSYSPENNPIGNEIDIAGQDLKSMAVAGTFFSAVAMNEELVEMMVKEDQFIGVANTYFPFGISMGSDGVIQDDSFKPRINLHRMSIRFDPGYDNYKYLLLAYPETNGTSTVAYLNENSLGESSPENVSFPSVGIEDRAYFGNDELAIPAEGEYNLYDPDEGDLDIKFELPDIKGAAEDHLVIPRPKVHLDDEESMVEAISWEYYTPGGNKISSPDNILTRIDVQISARSKDNNHLKGDYDFDEFHGPPRIANILVKDIEPEQEIDLTDEEIYWEDVGSIDMAYDDIFNIHYVVGFPNRTEGHTFANVTEDFVISDFNYKKEISATLLNQDKNPAEGKKVTFEFANGAIGSFGNKANSTTTITDKDGVATVNYYGPTEEIEATSTVIKISCEGLVDEANEAEIVVTNEISVSNPSMQLTFYGNENDPEVDLWLYDSRITSGIEAIATGWENEKVGIFTGYDIVASRNIPGLCRN